LGSKVKAGFIESYFVQTRRPIYSIAVSLPFFVAYEIGMTFFRPPYSYGDSGRNLAQIVLHRFSEMVGGSLAYALPVLIGMLILFYQHRREKNRFQNIDPGLAKREKQLAAAGANRFRPDFAFLMLGEGLLLAMPLSLLQREIPDVVRLMRAATQPAQKLVVPLSDKFYEIATYCGAGAYEELLFRLFLFSALLGLARFGLGLGRLTAVSMAAVISGVLFALFHFLVPGFSFDLVFFIFASIAGIYLAFICHFRSFGVAVAAHALYDVMLVFH
jgi:Type II CAAX prenyl endopeptidase Rce1-like